MTHSEEMWDSELIARDRAIARREVLVRERTEQILSDPGYVQEIAEEYSQPLSHLLVACKDSDGLYPLQKWLRERAEAMAEDEIPEDDE